MAQIVTITNPLTGQPAQVDQLDHTAQQIDDAVDRALQFGLGARGKELTPSDDLNTIWENGWYWWGANAPQNAPTEWPTSYPAYCMMRVWCYGVGDTIQEISSLNYDFKYTMKRICRNNVWTIEWDNPPMELGVEYRTTERYRGKPVYQKLIDFGALPNNTQKDVSIFASGETNTMECGIDVKLISHNNQAYKTLNTLTTQVLQNGGVTVKTNYNDSATSVYALCYYTKTTD